MKDDLIVFGSGELATLLVEHHGWLPDSIIFTDHDACRWGQLFLGRPVVPPAEAILGDCRIVIASAAFPAIRTSLNRLGVPDTRIDCEPARALLADIERYRWEYRFRHDPGARLAWDDFVNHRKPWYLGQILPWADLVAPMEPWEAPGGPVDAALRLGERMLSRRDKLDLRHQPGRYWIDGMERPNIYPLFGAIRRGDWAAARRLLPRFRLFVEHVGIGASPDLHTLLQPGFRDAGFVHRIIKAVDWFLDLVGDEPWSEMDASSVGMPVGIRYRGRLVNLDLVRQTYYVQRIETHISFTAARRRLVMELGAGFGETGRLLLARHAGQATYVAVDLPETLTVAAYYLAASCPALHIGTIDDFAEKERITRNDLERFDIVLLPNDMIERFENAAVDAVLNSASLGEMEPEVAGRYLVEIARVAGACFLSFNRAWGMVPSANDGWAETGIDIFSFGPEWRTHEDRKAVECDDVQRSYRELVLMRTIGMS